MLAGAGQKEKTPVGAGVWVAFRRPVKGRGNTKHGESLAQAECGCPEDRLWRLRWRRARSLSFMCGTAAAANSVSRSVAAATEVIGTGPGRVAKSRVGDFAESPSVVTSRHLMAGKTTLAISASTEPGGGLVQHP